MPETLGKPNGWNEWAKYVLKSIERLETNITQLDEKSDDHKEKMLAEIAIIKQEIVRLQVKAGMWGAAAAIVISAVMSTVFTILIG